MQNEFSNLQPPKMRRSAPGAKICMRSIEQYFENCESEKKDPTASGLCLAIGMSPQRLMDLSRKENELGAVLMAARLRLNDVLERKTDSMSILKIKQPIYCGYQDKPAAESPGEAVVKVFMEISGAEDPGA